MSRAVLFAAASVITIAHAGAQSPRPVELAAHQFPAFREIGAFYFDGLDESQVWVNLEPAHVDGPPDPIIFNITVRFPGTRLTREPATVGFRPQVRCIPAVYPTRPRLPVFTLRIDSSPRIDLSPDGKTSFFMPSCGGDNAGLNQTWDTVSATVPFAMLRQLVSAKTVTVEAIGFTVRLTPEDFEAARALVRAVEHGVTVKK
jgi:hypothetical protein